ncbi:hypothetical protein CP969_16655 [Streptomyces viridosporus T7A]|uniref:Uncharacterized protein n=1 Tax=Streptomyces viridosporus T7A TaxID=665577 RepID=A0ABX6AEC0_STRVD|nr:hypothetical protein CP969_16655 [Streptomyces viridosporus T7A]
MRHAVDRQPVAVRQERQRVAGDAHGETVLRPDARGLPGTAGPGGRGAPDGGSREEPGMRAPGQRRRQPAASSARMASR